MAELGDPAGPLSWTCAACRAANELPSTRRQAAFLDSEPIRREIKRRRPICRACGALMEPHTSGHSLLPIEDDLLEAWFADENLVFMMQDEDLIMAAAPLDVLLRFADRPDRRRKRRSIVQWLPMPKLYRHACGGEEFASADEVAACAARLRREGPSRVPRYMAAKLAPFLENP